jgi:hypothetical protein
MLGGSEQGAKAASRLIIVAAKRKSFRLASNAKEEYQSPQKSLKRVGDHVSATEQRAN